MVKNFILFLCALGALALCNGKTLIESLNAVRKCPNSGPCVFRKISESKNARLLFVAGIEGSGHHAMRAFFDVCVKSKNCINEDAFSLHFMTWVPKNKMIHGIFGSGRAFKNEHHEFLADMKAVHEHMHSLTKLNAAKVSVIGLSYGGESTHGLSGMFSYPNYDGVNKPLDIPDVVILAALAESAKLDLRIIVLLRNPVDTLLSYAARFELNVYAEALVMLDSLSALYSQLQLIDRKFYHCVRYETLFGMPSSERNNLISFIHPEALKMDQEKMFASFRRPSIHANRTEFAASGDQHLRYLLWRLEAQASLIESVCSR